MGLEIGRAGRAARAVGLFAAAMLATACQQSTGIDERGEVFAGIADSATVNLVGNEPFWGMEIVPQADGYLAKYSTPDNVEGSAFAVSRFAGNNGLGFSGEIDGEDVQVALTPGECNDGMSDRTYPYTATVAIGEATLYGCGYSSDEPYTGEEAQ
ncbi:COG3650 family protein [Erythrobacter sp. THAF29]|uniref:COG3650 family protein n=1 Tax=Erythrobacter sp. THAF29 TaxID=2587851 RepID=UPI0012698655|nr:hypothetical protein [Erythrobacter sp. THAF29]QFT78795.1 hypothetical protein FIU90_14690 [Erythrobacter sp. THAF29]